MKENPVWKKARDNKSNERTTKSPSRDETRPVRKAVRPSERNRSASLTRERPREKNPSYRETPKVVPDTSKDNKPFTFQARDTRSQSRDRFDASRKSYNDYKGRSNYNTRPRNYKNYSQNNPRNYSRDSSNSYSYSRSNSRDREWQDRKDRNQRNPNNKRNFSSWRDNGEQKQHTRDWNKRDRTDMYQCKSCRTIHVLGSYCPTTGDHIAESWEATQSLN